MLAEASCESDRLSAQRVTLDFKLNQVASFVRGVAASRYTGMILWGRGGIGKSHTVLQTLDEMGASYLLINSRLTGRGLFDLLVNNPQSLLVLEDCETLMDDRMAWGVLRSALFSQSRKVPPDRLVTWTAHATRLQTVFTGGIIYIANRDLSRQPEVQAMMERVPVLELCASDEEVKSLMYEQAVKGYRHGLDAMTADECLIVTDHLTDRVRQVGRSLDMRLQRLCFNTFLQCRSDGLVWEDQVDTLISRRTEYHPKSRAGRVAEQVEIARAIDAMNLTREEKVKRWEEETGTTERTYYRMLQKV
jgi:hypothetical protein